jgi:ABC-type multidrug transport system, ATPase component
MNCIELKNITKSFGTVTALDNINLKFEENKIYGLLGRNGAGKSTLLNIISNRIFANQGDVYINGISAVEDDTAQRNLYLMSEKTLYPEKMKIKDIFKWTKEFYPLFDMKYAENLAGQFDLNLNKSVRTLSTGYTSIFKVIIAMAVNTPFMLLDEPVLGLDANHRDLFYQLLIERYSKNPCTIVISTHLIEEVSNVIEQVIIIKKGSIIKNETRDELLEKGYTISGKASAVDSYIQNKNVIGVDSLGGLKTAYILRDQKELASPDQVLQIPEDLELSELDLQKLFIKLTNE